MTDTRDLVPRSDLLALAARIQELEAHLSRLPVARSAKTKGTDNCTNCKTDACTHCHTGQCTNCAGDAFGEVLLPGELERLSGRELVKRLQTGRAIKK